MCRVVSFSEQSHCAVVQIPGMQEIWEYYLPYLAAEIKYLTIVEMIRNGVFYCIESKFGLKN